MPIKEGRSACLTGPRARPPTPTPSATTGWGTRTTTWGATRRPLLPSNRPSPWTPALCMRTGALASIYRRLGDEAAFRQRGGAGAAADGPGHRVQPGLLRQHLRRRGRGAGAAGGGHRRAPRPAKTGSRQRLLRLTRPRRSARSGVGGRLRRSNRSVCDQGEKPHEH